MGFLKKIGSGISKTAKPIAKAVAAPVQATRDIVRGKNVGETLKKAGLNTLGGIEAPAAFISDRLRNTRIGQNALGFVDSLTAGTATQVTSLSATIGRMNRGKTITKSEWASSAKSTAIGTAKVGVAVASFGAASGLAAGAGAGSSLSFSAGALGASKTLGVAENIITGKANSSDWATVVDSIIPGAGSWVKTGSEFAKGFKQPSQGALPGFAYDPMGATTGSIAPQGPQKPSLMPYVFAVIAAAYILSRKG